MGITGTPLKSAELSSCFTSVSAKAGFEIPLFLIWFIIGNWAPIPEVWVGMGWMTIGLIWVTAILAPEFVRAVGIPLIVVAVVTAMGATAAGKTFCIVDVCTYLLSITGTGVCTTVWWVLNVRGDRGGRGDIAGPVNKVAMLLKQSLKFVMSHSSWLSTIWDGCVDAIPLEKGGRNVGVFIGCDGNIMFACAIVAANCCYLCLRLRYQRTRNPLMTVRKKTTNMVSTPDFVEALWWIACVCSVWARCSTAFCTCRWFWISKPIDLLIYSILTRTTINYLLQSLLRSFRLQKQP